MEVSGAAPLAFHLSAIPIPALRAGLPIGSSRNSWFCRLLPKQVIAPFLGVVRHYSLPALRAWPNILSEYLQITADILSLDILGRRAYFAP